MDKCCFSFTTDDISNETFPLSITSGYLRFFQRLRSGCIAVVGFPVTFEEALVMADNLGWGSSDNIPVLIAVQSLSLEDPIVANFSYNLFNLSCTSCLTEEVSFDADLIFFSISDTKFGIFCYFCDVVSKVLAGGNSTTSGLSLNQLLRLSKQLNGHGYANHVLLRASSIMDLRRTSWCLEASDSEENIENYYKVLAVCWFTQLVLISPLQTILNFTFVTENALIPKKERDSIRWFLQAEMFDTIFQSVLIEQVIIRDKHTTLDKFPFDVIACLTSENLETFYFGVVAVIDWTFWLLLLLVAICYATNMIYKNLCGGLDLLWIFFSLSYRKNHPRMGVIFLLPFITYLAWTYQAFISSESLYLAKFPNVFNLIDLHYRVWTQAYVLKNNKAILKSICSGMPRIIANQFSSGVKKFLKKSIKLVDMFNAPPGIFDFGFGGNYTLLETIEVMAREKLFLVSNIMPTLYYAFRGGMTISVKNKYYCQVIGLGKEFGLGVTFPYTLRSSGYPSQRFDEALGHWTTAGFTSKATGEAFKLFIRKKQLQYLDVKDALVVPVEPLGLWSSVGVSIGVLVGVEVTLFIMIIAWLFRFRWTNRIRSEVVPEACGSVNMEIESKVGKEDMVDIEEEEIGGTSAEKKIVSDETELEAVKNN